MTQPTYSPFIPLTLNPTFHPVVFPPTETPSFAPSVIPSIKPRARPSMEPVATPSLYPSMNPTHQPTVKPISNPTDEPTAIPLHPPTASPINKDPTFVPTMAVSLDPKLQVCKGRIYSENPLILSPNDGCASFFWGNIEEVQNSYMSTICSCTDVGQLLIPNALISKIGAAREDGFPTISSIIMGNKISITIYATDDNSGPDKYVLGPGEVADLTKIKRLSGKGLWNDRVRSLQIMSWNECTIHEVNFIKLFSFDFFNINLICL